jgi:hypothetical protein
MNKYVLITWPDSQEIMDEEWFQDECILMNDENRLDEIGSSAYFVPEERYNKLLFEREVGRYRSFDFENGY